MKTLTLTGLLVAGVLAAAGSGVIGQTDTKNADSDHVCPAQRAAMAKAAKASGEGASCCSASAQQFVTAEVQEKSCGGCCSEKAEASTLVTTEVAEEKSCDGSSCDAGGGCCSEKAKATTLVTTEAKQEKTCDGSSCEAGGGCCSEKAEAATLVTTEAKQEKTCDGSSCEAGGGCCSEKASTVVAEGDATEGVCPVTLAMSELPTLVYAVGEQKVCCEKMAGELAKKESDSVHYVVAEKAYDTKPEAMKALVEKTETLVNAYVAPKKCSESGNTTIAGKTCSCPVETAARVEAVESAVKTVSMKYVVDGQEAACGNCAAARSKETGKPVEYVVAGQSTTCEMTARLNLARAKYKAAVEAVVAVEKK